MYTDAVPTVVGHRHGRRVRCIGLDVVDAVFRHTASRVYESFTWYF